MSVGEAAEKQVISGKLSAMSIDPSQGSKGFFFVAPPNTEETVNLSCFASSYPRRTRADAF
jgi:hypothetical protein